MCHIWAGAHETQKRLRDALELKLWVIVSPLTWMIRAKLVLRKTSSKSAYPLNHLSSPLPSIATDYLIGWGQHNWSICLNADRHVDSSLWSL